MSKHTKGPWIFDGEYVWADSISGYVAGPSTDDLMSGNCIARNQANEIIIANGFLIAAAPELLEALEQTQSLLESLGLQSSDEYQANAEALAKAKGEQ